MNKKQPGPAVIVLMVAGIIVALGFVVSQLTGGDPAPVQNLPAAGPATVAAGSGTPETPADESAKRIASTVGGEAVLAPAANPFLFVPKPQVQAPGGIPAPAGPATPAPFNQGNPQIARGNNPPSGLPSVGSGGTGVIGPMPIEMPKAEPELAGTLLGDRPSAVFRNDRRLVIVPVGGVFQGWKVLSVEHGGVRVRTDGRIVSLAVGSGKRTAAIRSERSQVTEPVRSEQRQYVHELKSADSQAEVAAYAATSLTGQPVPVVSEPNSITRDLTGDVPAGADNPFTSPANPGDQNPQPGGPASPGPQTPAANPSTLPPAGDKGVPMPPADPPVNTEKVIPQPMDKPRDLVVRP